MIKQVTEEKLWLAMQDVKDPEIPAVSIVEMGMVHSIQISSGTVKLALLPTFMGCPALDMIRERVIDRLDQEGLKQVEVIFLVDPPWTSNRITYEGSKKLQQFGIAIATRSHSKLVIPPCPYCDSNEGIIENLFGPTACRSIFYCKRCHQPFEGIKPV